MINGVRCFVFFPSPLKFSTRPFIIFLSLSLSLLCGCFVDGFFKLFPPYACRPFLSYFFVHVCRMMLLLFLRHLRVFPQNSCLFVLYLVKLRCILKILMIHSVVEYKNNLCRCSFPSPPPFVPFFVPCFFCLIFRRSIGYHLLSSFPSSSAFCLFISPLFYRS